MVETLKSRKIEQSNGNSLYKNFSVKKLEANGWEDKIEDIMEEIDLWDIDITELADRYRDYVIQKDTPDLEIYGKMVWTLAYILRMQANHLNGNGDGHPARDPQPTEDLGDWDEWDLESADEEGIFVPQKMKLPIKRKPKRKISLDELKAAFRKAIILGRDRYNKAIREGSLSIGFDIDIKDITDRITETFDRVKSLLTSGKRKAKFDEILSSDTKDEKITKFVHLLYLESENKIKCSQPEFLGDIEIELTSK